MTAKNLTIYRTMISIKKQRTILCASSDLQMNAWELYPKWNGQDVDKPFFSRSLIGIWEYKMVNNGSLWDE